MYTVIEQLSKWIVNGKIHVSHCYSVRHASAGERYESHGSEFEWETWI